MRWRSCGYSSSCRSLPARSPDGCSDRRRSRAERAKMRPPVSPRPGVACGREADLPGCCCLVRADLDEADGAPPRQLLRPVAIAGDVGRTVEADAADVAMAVEMVA